MVLRKEKEKIRYTYLLLTIFVCLSILVAGCTKSVVVEETSDDNDDGKDLPNEIKEPDLDVKDTKTEIEHNEELITNLIADGTYSDEVTYNYHSGDETIKIDLTVKDDIVTAASLVSVGDTHKYSQQLIDGVNAALPELVVGKKINEINLPKQISGSSLTTAALKTHLEGLVERY